MERNHSTDRPPRSTRAATMLATLLLTGGVTGTLVLGAAVALPASGAERAAAVHGKKPQPTTSRSATASSSPTSSPTATATSSPSVTDTPTPEPSPSAPTPSAEPTTSSEPSPTATATATASATTNCAADTAKAFEGNLYCPGEIAGVEAGAYGLNSRVILSVTVTGVEGDLVSIMGGPECWADPSSTEPMYCAAIMGTMVVDFAGAEQLPAPSTGIELYGVTRSGGRLQPDGFVTIAWCDPDYCP
jgi:hypothetical protein